MMIPNYLDITRIIDDQSILKLFRAVEDYGGALRFVGGAVRDALAGLKGFEIDLATDLSTDELLEACNENGLKTVSLGFKFARTGVIINNKVLEVSSLHKKVQNKLTDSDLSFTDDWNADASQRDLTINAVYADEHGNVFDYYNGINDLKDGIVRFIDNPNEKIIEQPIRILRFFRFYSTFSKTEPDKRSLQACVENRELLKTLTTEKIREEFFKILTTPNAGKTIELMRQNDILDFVLPHDIYANKLQFLDELIVLNHQKPDIVRRLFVLFGPDKNLADSIATRFKLTKVQKLRLVDLARFSFDNNKVQDFSYLQKVLFLHGSEFVKDKILVSFVEQNKFSDQLQDLFNRIDKMQIPSFPLHGKDLIDLGMTDCSPIKEVLGRLKDMWIKSDFKMSLTELQSEAQKMIK